MEFERDIADLGSKDGPGLDSEDGLPRAWPQSTAWMITFTDLVSLMLTFFVMLFAMSNVKVDKWESMTDALSQSLNPERVKSEARPTAEFNVSTAYPRPAINLDYLFGVLEELISNDPALVRSRVIRREDRLILALPEDMLFERGRAQLTERARRVLFDLAGVLRNIENRLSVNGHSAASRLTSGSTGQTFGGTYVSNWERSLAHAVAVSNALRRAGYIDEISVHGYADSRYFELPAAMDEESRRALARRVDIVVLPTAEGT